MNVCISRIPENETIVKGRSKCPRCGCILGARDLIPVVSFFLLKGRCRHCGECISLRYPVVEILTAVIFLSLVFVYGLTAELILYWVLAGIMIAAAFIDIEHLRIPNSLVLFGLISGFILHLIFGTAGFSEMGLGLLAGGLPLFVIYLVSRGGMGAGDVKLAAVIGLYLGWKLFLVSFFFTSAAGALVGILLILIGKKSRKAPVPFAPFLAFGSMVSVLWGSEILAWYLGTYI